MNKTEKRKLTVKLICEMIEKQYPEYSIDESEGGRLNLSPSWGKGCIDDIEFSRSDYSLYTFDWASARTKADELQMQKRIDKIVEQVNAL